jgi:hypothetical protein
LNRQFDRLPERCHQCKDWMTGAAAKIAPNGSRDGAEAAS